MTVLDFVVLALGVWRMSSLLANEDGPWRMFKLFRDWVCLKYPGIGEGLICEWCNSVWLGTLTTIAYLQLGGRLIWFYLPLALSTCTIMLKFFRERMER